MCPNECPGLYDVYGDEFEALYTSYEEKGKGRKTIKARELWEKILESQIETEHHICCIKMQQTENRIKKFRNDSFFKLVYRNYGIHFKDEIAVCNLASISLPMFVENGKFNHELMFKVTKRVTET
jgi:ribonucleoside-diphosphate reductase alpha chain